MRANHGFMEVTVYVRSSRTSYKDITGRFHLTSSRSISAQKIATDKARCLSPGSTEEEKARPNIERLSEPDVWFRRLLCRSSKGSFMGAAFGRPLWRSIYSAVCFTVENKNRELLGRKKKKAVSTRGKVAANCNFRLFLLFSRESA